MDFWVFPPSMASLVAQMEKKICLQCWRPGFNPWIGRISWRRAWQLTPGFLPGKSQGQRSLAGCRPWGRRVRHDWVIKTFIFTPLQGSPLYSAEQIMPHVHLALLHWSQVKASPGVTWWHQSVVWTSFQHLSLSQAESLRDRELATLANVGLEIWKEQLHWPLTSQVARSPGCGQFSEPSWPGHCTQWLKSKANRGVGLKVFQRCG